MLYEQFVELNYDTMKNSAMKRNTKIFMLMSKFIATKSPSQCRSHHQKFYKNLIQKMELKKLSSLSNMQKYGNMMQKIQVHEDRHEGEEEKGKEMVHTNFNNQFLKRYNQKKKLA